MADFSLQDLWWLKPAQQDNPLPAMQLGVQIVQQKARMDLAERDLANDIARTSLMREEQMFKQQIMLKVDAGNSELAKAAAGITDFSDQAQMKPIYDIGAKYGFLVGTKGWDGIINTHERAVSAKRLGANTQSMIDRRAAQTELAELEVERKALLADSTIDLNDDRILDNNARRSLALSKQALDEKKFELQEMLAGSRMDVDDATIAAKQQDINLAERRMLIQEGNLALRDKELNQKGRRLSMRDETSYKNELKALNDEEKAKLKAAELDAPETDRLRKFYNLKRRAITDRFYGNKPSETNAPAAVASPAAAAPNNDAKAQDIKDSFKAGTITKEQALQQLRELGFK